MEAACLGYGMGVLLSVFRVNAALKTARVNAAGRVQGVLMVIRMWFVRIDNASTLS